MKSPFPYYGGKSTISKDVWQALGQPKHYIEPFFGSGAVLLNRPKHDPTSYMETICDKDGFIANVWRALKFSPDAVAEWCDWPVNHADLSARKKRLIENESRLLENLIADDEWHDVKMAGYWIWAASCWIGSGLTRPNARPHVSDGGNGIHAIGQIPHVSDGGNGVHAIGQRPHVSHGGKGRFNTNIYDWFQKISERLRYVRVICGDWTRVCGGEWQDKAGDVGIFMDPPYGITDRDTTVYHHDSTTVAVDVRKWCIERGGIPSYRIVLAGYEEHLELLEHGWTAKNWKANGGYANTSSNDTQGDVNRKREYLYFSPYCNKAVKQQKLF